MTQDRASTGKGRVWARYKDMIEDWVFFFVCESESTVFESAWSEYSSKTSASKTKPPPPPTQEPKESKKKDGEPPRKAQKVAGSSLSSSPLAEATKSCMAYVKAESSATSLLGRIETDSRWSWAASFKADLSEPLEHMQSLKTGFVQEFIACDISVLKSRYGKSDLEKKTSDIPGLLDKAIAKTETELSQLHRMFDARVRRT